MTVVADRGRFRQILYNLLSNAIKYTPDGGEIRVEAEDAATEVRVTVADNGVGIAATDLSRVFEEFRQVGAEQRSRRRDRPRSRAVAGASIEAHGGRIDLESTIGMGSRVHRLIPEADGAR